MAISLSWVVRSTCSALEVPHHHSTTLSGWAREISTETTPSRLETSVRASRQHAERALPLASLPTSYNFIKYGDTDILDGVAYTVSRAWTSQSEGRILVTIADLNSPSSATVDVLFDVGGSLFTPKAIKVQDDGKILIGGFIDTGTDPIMFLLRFNSDGTSDGTTFALPASGDLSPDGIDQINDIGLFSDGRIAVVGRSGDGAFSARFLADGTLDTSYSTDGYHVYLPSSGSAEFHELAAGQRVRAVGAVNGDVLIADYQ